MDPLRLSDQELVAEILGKRKAERLCQRPLSELLAEAEKDNRSYGKLLAALELVRRALREKIVSDVALSSPEAVRDYLRLCLAGKEHEVFMVLYLDSQNRLLDSEELFRGTLAQTSVYPREIVKHVLRHNSAAVIFAHNHPSGVAEPSRADEILTQSLKQALSLVDVKVLDHFIIGADSVMSFAARGLL